jgi:hypothetical protein
MYNPNFLKMSLQSYVTAPAHMRNLFESLFDLLLAAFYMRLTLCFCVVANDSYRKTMDQIQGQSRSNNSAW